MNITACNDYNSINSTVAWKIETRNGVAFRVPQMDLNYCKIVRSENRASPSNFDMYTDGYTYHYLNIIKAVTLKDSVLMG
jgi:hypothetical protein